MRVNHRKAAFNAIWKLAKFDEPHGRRRQRTAATTARCAMLIHHSSIYVGARLLSGLFGIVATSLLTRLLGLEGYGVYSIALLVMFFGQLAAFDWIGQGLARFGQNAEDRAGLIATITAIFAAMAFATILVAALVIFLGDWRPEEQQAIYAGLVLAWSTGWFELAARFEIVRLEPLRYLMMNFARSALALVLGVGAAWATGDPVIAAFALALANLIASFAGRFFSEVAAVRPIPDKILAPKLIAFGAPFAISMAVEAVAQGGPRFVVQDALSLPALAAFTATVLLIQNVIMLAASGLSSAAYTLAIRSMTDPDPGALRRQLRANGTLLLFVIAPTAIGLAVVAKPLAPILVGEDFAPSVAALAPWLAISALFGCFRGYYLDHSFQIAEKTQLQIVVSAISAVTAIGLSFALIPSMGIEGAGAAVLAANVAGVAAAYLLGRLAVPMPFPWAGAARIFAGCVMMALIVHQIEGDTLGALILQVIIGGMVYVAATLAFNTLGLRAAMLARLEKLLQS